MTLQLSGAPPELDTIGSTMPVGDIVDILVAHGCTDLRSLLDLGACDKTPCTWGGFGDLYQGRLMNGDKVAIKTLKIHNGDNNKGEILKNAAREIYHWSKLNHPNVLPLTGLTIFPDCLSMVSKWMENGNLKSFLEKNSLADADKIRLCMDVRFGLCYLHMNDVVHGDLKAVNIMISSRRVAMIADFGSIKAKESTLKFTREGGGAFTPRWAAPELLKSPHPLVSKATDVYSYGMVVLEVLTGKVPYDGKSEWEVAALVAFNQVHELPARPSTGVSDRLWDTLRLCWQRDPLKRPHITQIRVTDTGGGLPQRKSWFGGWLGKRQKSRRALWSQDFAQGRRVDFEAYSPPRLHALVVGIETYLQKPCLVGAVRSADNVLKFLVDKLATPASHIITLRDAEATHASIILALEELQEDPRIQYGAPILIYYAGRSGEMDTSPEWDERHDDAAKIRVIFPYDYDQELEGERVGYISEKTMVILLDQLAAVKGNNITVIFDSTKALSTGIHQASHVCLTARSADETAWEEEDQGVFTTALLETIQMYGVDKLTYHSLVARLPHLDKQTPRCDGTNKHRLLFDARKPSQISEKLNPGAWVPLRANLGALIALVFDMKAQALQAGIHWLDELGKIKAEETTIYEDQVPAGLIKVQSSLVSPLHALVIGIDIYLNQPNLAGAVHDADEVCLFLINDLSTPPSHITDLRNAAATRKGIINAFLKLENDPKIPRGSPILIYFAGHGGLVDPSAEQTEWLGSANKIQVIFPHDYGEPCVGKDGNEEKVNCIPDWTIAGLLNKLTEAKGDNVTVIFDSCHSASGSREWPSGGGRRARAAKAMFGIPVDIDNDVLECTPSTTGPIPRYMGSPFSAHQRSHIHLAACGSNEHAWEQDGHGEFTEALLKTIRAYGIDKVTYRNFVMGLPYLAKQTPHCYGVYRDRLYFDGQVPSRKVVYVPVVYDPMEKTLTLQAGVASGVTDGSVWELRQYAILGDEGMVGTITALQPGISTTEMEAENAGDAEFWTLCESGTPYESGEVKLFARLLRSGPGNELKVWFSPEAKRLIFPKLEYGKPQAADWVSHEFGYVAHTAQDSADMVVRIYESREASPTRPSAPSNGPNAEPEAEFVLCNCFATKYGVSTLSQRKPARRSEVETVLFAAARWHWYLRHTNDEHTKSLVEMEMFKIAKRSQVNGVYSSNHWQQLKAHERGSNLNETGVVDFGVHREDLYGIRLKSAVDRPLYVRMFYFDMKTFSIDNQFGHAVGDDRADPEIGRRGQFTIGDDGLGGTPLLFELEAEDTVDIGYMKVFWSTAPLELDHLPQESAFIDKTKPGTPRRTALCWDGGKSDWGTTSMVLVQRNPRDNL